MHMYHVRASIKYNTLHRIQPKESPLNIKAHFIRNFHAFRDHAQIYVQGGKGGMGCISFEKRYNKKRPNGHNGGPGGDVYIITNNNKFDLTFNKFHYIGGKGGNGSSEMNGKKGKETYIEVPPGVSIFEIIENNDSTNNTPFTRIHIKDLFENKQRVLIAEGGIGGFGNATLSRDQYNDTNLQTEGIIPIQKRIELQLRLIADVGVVGFPNAGKSTFISTISHANPKIGCYPFTTVSPLVTTVPVSCDNMTYSHFTIADIPGLVLGSHLKRGQGNDFLRHIELTKIFLYIIDIAKIACQDKDDPVKTFLILRKELEMYNPELLSRPSIVFLNKIDVRPVACSINIERMHHVVPSTIPIYVGSSRTGVGIPPLIDALQRLVWSNTNSLISNNVD